MQVSVELEQSWDTKKEFIAYLEELINFIEKYPQVEWFVDVQPLKCGEYQLNLTHL